MQEPVTVEAPKKGRGRAKKTVAVEVESETVQEVEEKQEVSSPVK